MFYQFFSRIFAPYIVLSFLRLFNRVKIYGREHIPANGPVVIIANHISSWDPVFLYCLIRRRAYFMAKAELFQIPPLRLLFKHICVFPVARDTVDRKAIRTALKVLEEGHILTIFPEGSRSKTGELMPFKAGASLFAHHTKATVVPVLFENTQKTFPSSIWQKIRITFGKPLDLSMYHDKKANSALFQTMSETFRQSLENLKADKEFR
ncbi:MAG: 1-acyl-sn-glycerol-3-phosphate acyltransferase [Clostridiales bacterium]|nr:1-acyl-sn-glycerol-3-phosphate acyltransferase [Clostridiales bacterium]